MKDFKVISEAEDSYHIKHANGKAFTVEKKGLSPKAHAMIKKLCGGGIAKMSGGGTAGEGTEAGSLTIDPNGAEMPDYGMTPGPSPAPQVEESVVGKYPPIVAPVSPDQSAFNPPPAPAAAQQQNPIAQNLTETNALLEKQKGDINKYTGSIDQASSDQQSAQQDFINKQAAIKSPQQISDEYKAKDDQLMQGFMNKQVDPERYLHNLSTGSKIAAAVGLLFSGMGAGKNGTNLAAQAIDNSIQGDIEAQKTDQSKAMNLWKMNREHRHDDEQATIATQNQLLSGVQAKIALSASKIQNADAHLRSSEMINQIEQQKIANRQRLGLLQGMGGNMQIEPAQLVPSMVPPEHQKQALMEAGQAKAAAESEDNLLKLFDQAAEQNRPATGRSMTSLMNTVPGYETPATRGLIALADPLIHDSEGRINESEQKDLRGILPKWGDSDETVAANRVQFKNFINHKKSAPTLKAFGIDVNNFASTSSNPTARFTPEQQKFYQWAKAQPATNEKAQMTLKKLGVL